MVLIDFDVPTNPETSDAEIMVLAAFLQSQRVRVRIHFDSPRSVLSPEGTERVFISLSGDAHFLAGD